MIPLAEQDRSLWDQEAIAEGVAIVTAALAQGSVGYYYQLQAAIAAVHDEAAEADATDWPQILALYGLLEQMSENPMVMLNNAIAAAMVYGPDAGLTLLESLDTDDRVAVTTALTPSGVTSWKWPATSMVPSRITGLPRTQRGTPPNSAISSHVPRGSRPTWGSRTPDPFRSRFSYIARHDRYPSGLERSCDP